MRDQITDRKVVAVDLRTEEGVGVVDTTTGEGAVEVDTAIEQTLVEGDIMAAATGDIAIELVLLPLCETMTHRPGREGDSMIEK